jgi:hypothetical protein
MRIVIPFLQPMHTDKDLLRLGCNAMILIRGPASFSLSLIDRIFRAQIDSLPFKFTNKSPRPPST